MTTGYYRQPNLEPSGFYNPYLPYPDIAQGVRGFTSGLEERKRYEQEQALKQQQMGLEERRTKVQEESLAFRKQQKPELPDYVQKAQYLVQFFPDEYDMGKAMKEVLKIKPSENIPATIADKNFEQYLTGAFGDNWREELTPDWFWDMKAEYDRRTRPVKEGSGATAKKELFNILTGESDQMARAQLRIAEAKAGDVFYMLATQQKNQEMLAQMDSKYDKMLQDYVTMLREGTKIKLQEWTRIYGKDIDVTLPENQGETKVIDSGPNKGTWQRIGNTDQWRKIK